MHRDATTDCRVSKYRLYSRLRICLSIMKDLNGSMTRSTFHCAYSWMESLAGTKSNWKRTEILGKPPIITTTTPTAGTSEPIAPQHPPEVRSGGICSLRYSQNSSHIIP